MMRKMFFLVLAMFLFSFATHVYATNNETVDSIMTIHGNIPTSTIFFAVAGEPDTGSITLEPNQTTLVSCWGTAFDLDGMDDLDNLTSVIYADSSDRFAPENASVRYENNTCDLSDFNFGGGWNCTFNVQYYAEPSEWTCAVNITNVDPEFYNDTVNTTSTVEDLVALSVHNKTVDFGLRAVGINYTADTEVVVYNEGNVELNLQLDAFNSSSVFEDDSDQAFNCSIGHIPVHYLRFSLNDNDDYLDAVPMEEVGATADQPLSLAQRVFGQGTDLPTFASTYWAPAVPMNIAGTCTGRIMYIGVPA